MGSEMSSEVHFKHLAKIITYSLQGYTNCDACNYLTITIAEIMCTIHLLLLKLTVQSYFWYVASIHIELTVVMETFSQGAMSPIFS